MAKHSTHEPTPSVAEPPKVSGVCEHCEVAGLIGAELLPYSFENKGERHWLHSRCMPFAYAAWKAKQ